MGSREKMIWRSTQEESASQYHVRAYEETSGFRRKGSGRMDTQKIHRYRPEDGREALHLLLCSSTPLSIQGEAGVQSQLEDWRLVLVLLLKFR